MLLAQGELVWSAEARDWKFCFVPAFGAVYTAVPRSALIETSKLVIFVKMCQVMCGHIQLLLF